MVPVDVVLPADAMAAVDALVPVGAVVLEAAVPLDVGRSGLDDYSMGSAATADADSGWPLPQAPAVLGFHLVELQAARASVLHSAFQPRVAVV
jgi:hypothetical protein